MAALGFENQRDFHPMRFLVAAIDDCDASERAVSELMGGGLSPQDVRMFHGHHPAEHVGSTGTPSGQLQHALGYLQDSLSIEGSILREYEEHGSAGGHILLIDVNRDDQINNLTQALASGQAHDVRLLAYSHIADPLPSS